MSVNAGLPPIAAVCFELEGDEYREIARSVDGVLALTRPFEVTADLVRTRR